MAQSLGELYVNLSVRSQGFAEGLNKASEAVAKTANKIKEVTEKVGGFFTAVAATSGALVAVAAQSNAKVGREVDRLKGSFTVLAEAVATTLLPTIRQLSNVVTGLVATWRGLSPETRAAVGNFAAFATTAALVSAALGKTMGLVSGVASVIGAIGPAVLAVLPELAVLALALAVVGLTAGVIYKQWKKADLSLREVVTGWALTVGDLATGVVEVMSTAASEVANLVGGILSTFAGMVVGVLDAVTSSVRTVAGMLSPLAGSAGLGAISKKLEEISKFSAGDALKTGVGVAKGAGTAVVGAALSPMANLLGATAGTALQNVMVAKQALDKIGSGLSSAADDAGEMFSDAFQASGLKASLGEFSTFIEDILSGKKGAAVAAEVVARAPVEVSTVGGGGGPGAGMSDELRNFASGRGSSVWQAYTKEVERTASLASEAAQDAKVSIVDRALGSLGRLGSVISNAMQAAAAGPMAVLASIAVDLLSQSATFQKVVGVLNGILQSVADALGRLMEPLVPLLGAISMLVNGVLRALEPAFTAFNALIMPLVPPLVVAAQVLGALAPVLAIFISLLQSILQPWRILVGPVMHALFTVLKFAGVSILTVVKGIAGVWNGIIGAIQSVFRSLARISVFGAKPLGFLEGWADSLGKAKVDVTAMAQALHDLQGLTWESAYAIANEEAARVSNTAAMDKATESLKNVPDGWRKALRVMQAQDRQQGPGGASGGGASTPPSSGAPQPTGPAGEPAGGDGDLIPAPTVEDGVGIIKRAQRQIFGMGKTSAESSGASVTQTINIVGYDITQALDAAARKGMVTSSRAGMAKSGLSTSGGKPKPYGTL